MELNYLRSIVILKAIAVSDATKETWAKTLMVTEGFAESGLANMRLRDEVVAEMLDNNWIEKSNENVFLVTPQGQAELEGARYLNLVS